MDWQLASLNGPYLGVFREAKKKEEERAASFGPMRRSWRRSSRLLEKGTAARPWLAGANFSIADICLGPIIDRALAFPITLPALPGVRAWRDKLVARAPTAYRKAEPAYGAERPESGGRHRARHHGARHRGDLGASAGIQVAAFDADRGQAR